MAKQRKTFDPNLKLDVVRVITVPDLCARRVVGWAMAPNMKAELICNALNMAIQQRRPAPGLIVLSDRGSRSASELYPFILADLSAAAEAS